MSDFTDRDAWGKHKWKKETTWWDDLEVDSDECKANFSSVFDWLESVAPDPYEHDYILYTDGSGCAKGWGGYAALWERIELNGDYRSPVESGTLVSGTYGSTVQRCEFNAFLDGVHKILTTRAAELKDQALGDEALLYKYATEGLLNQLTGPDRLSILWYTDRSNLAQGLLYDEEGDPLASREKERDLWMRWSFMAKHVCITPMCLPRNTIEGQAVCDKLAGEARAAMMATQEVFDKSTNKFYPTETWKKNKSQKVIF